MPIKYIGKVTSYSGKPLEEILMKLNNFGLGRIVYRNKFERYPEASYYRITNVGPVVDREPRSYNEKYRMENNKFHKTKIQVSGQKVFRGRDVGELQIGAAHKADWRLVPRQEEEKWLASKAPPKQITIVDDKKHFPPLLERMIMKEKKLSERPMLQFEPSKSRLSFVQAKSSLE